MVEHQWMFPGNQYCPVIPKSRNKMTKSVKERASAKEFKNGLYYKQRQFQKQMYSMTITAKARNQAFKEKLSRCDSMSLCDPRTPEIEAGGGAPDQPGLRIQIPAQPLLAWSALRQSKVGMVAHICNSII